MTRWAKGAEFASLPGCAPSPPLRDAGLLPGFTGREGLFAVNQGRESR